MCGIVGILNKEPDKPVDVRLLRAMSRSVAHRGPDDRGIYVSGSDGLAHRPLQFCAGNERQQTAIIDLKSTETPVPTGLLMDG